MENELTSEYGKQEEKAKVPKTHINFGVPIGGVLIALFVIYYVLNWSFQRDFRAWIPTFVFIALIIIAQLNHATAVKGDITYGSLFAKGFKTTAVATCIYVVFIILFVLLVPSYKDQMLEVSRQGMIKKGLSADQIKPAMAMIKKFFLLSTIGGAIIGELIVGLIGSLIGAAIAKKNPRPQLGSLN